MRKILACICYVLYITIGKHLPTFRNSYKDLFVFIRYCLVRGYVEECGNKVNVQPHATIARRVCIGDFSGIGRNSLVSGGDKNRQACYDGA